jgi:hypothetical protein
MAKILFVHGMRMQHYGGDVLRAKWRQALIRGLRETAWGRANPEQLPKKNDIELVYWGDLFRPADGPDSDTDITKGLGIDDLRSAYYALLRGLVRAADRLSFWDQDGRPVGPVALLVNRLVYQSAVYMNNGPVQNPDPAEKKGAFFQIQARFESALGDDTRIVIAHSLGTVIAYEGLCLNPHNVDTFITVGAPIATPHLILEPLRERLSRLLHHSPDLSPPWPGVRQWLNFYAPADVWSVPVKRIASVFGGDLAARASIRDIAVMHGNPHDFVETHKLTTYLKHAELRNEIAHALESCLSTEGPTEDPTERSTHDPIADTADYAALEAFI